MSEYLTQAEARRRYYDRRWAGTGHSYGEVESLIPMFPEGTREYAEYCEQLTGALRSWSPGWTGSAALAGNGDGNEQTGRHCAHEGASA